MHSIAFFPTLASGVATLYFLCRLAMDPGSRRWLLFAALAMLHGIGVVVMETYIRAPNVFVGDLLWKSGVLCAVTAAVGIFGAMWCARTKDDPFAVPGTIVVLLVFGVLIGVRMWAYAQFGSYE